jgi:hypothetical protein
MACRVFLLRQLPDDLIITGLRAAADDFAVYRVSIHRGNAVEPIWMTTFSHALEISFPHSSQIIERHQGEIRVVTSQVGQVLLKQADVAMGIRDKLGYRLSLRFCQNGLLDKRGDLKDAAGRIIGFWYYETDGPEIPPVQLVFDELPIFTSKLTAQTPAQNPPEEPPPAKTWRQLPAQF